MWRSGVIRGMIGVVMTTTQEETQMQENASHPPMRWLGIVRDASMALSGAGVPSMATGGDEDEIDRLVRRLNWLREKERA
jgi:hypothetical protein